MMSSQFYYQPVSPVTGEPGTGFPTLQDNEVTGLLAQAQEAYSSWRSLSPSERAMWVNRAAAILRQRRDEYAMLATKEMGKLIAQSYYEVDLSASILEYYASHAEKFVEVQTLAEAPDCRVYTEPIGVILAIEPWNFPFYQLARVAGPQLIAGNVVLAKHAPSVPQCALAFEKLFVDAGAPRGIWTNLFCTNEQAGLLIKDDRVRGVTLTGSEAAGASIAKQAGSELKKVVLELGGSDPFIILPDADLQPAIKKAADARLTNMGQACIGSKRFIVVGQERGQQVLQGMKEIFEALKAGDPTDKDTSLGPIVNKKILDGLLKQVDEAAKAGARVVTGGKQVDRPGFFMEPTIMTNITDQNPLFQQETFGPVASFYVVDTEEQAVRLANATPFGLGSSVLSDDVEHARSVAAKIESGMVFINSGGYSTPEVPFGGVKRSGFGRELSELGTSEFVNKKLVRVRA